MLEWVNSPLLFTDKDSLAYEVVGHDLYVGMGEFTTSLH